MSKPLKKLSIDQAQFSAASTAVGVDQDHATALWNEMQNRAAKPNGAMWFYLVAGALGIPGALFIAAWFGDSLSAGTAAFAAGLMSVAFMFGGYQFDKRDARVPAGLAYIIASLMAWAAAFAFETAVFNHSGSYDGAVLLQAIVVIVVSGALSWRSGIAFASLPALIAGAVGVVSMTNLLSGESISFDSFGSRTNAFHWALVAYGMALNQFFFWLDGKTDDDYSFWGYFVGVMSFWLGLVFISKGDLGWALCALVGLVSIGVSVYRQRTIFAIAGVTAVLSWVFYMDTRLFEHNALGFGISLLVLSGGIAVCGAWYWKNADRVHAWLRDRLPSKK
jgi:hypothetical protein